MKKFIINGQNLLMMKNIKNILKNKNITYII